MLRPCSRMSPERTVVIGDRTVQPTAEAVQHVRPAVIYHCAGAAHVGRSFQRNAFMLKQLTIGVLSVLAIVCGTAAQDNSTKDNSTNDNPTKQVSDIQDLLRWQAAGARRAMQAGFDIVYVYAGMGYLPYEFLLPEYNRRTDAYAPLLERWLD